MSEEAFARDSGSECRNVLSPSSLPLLAASNSEDQSEEFSLYWQP